jgi:hypothetical protein
MKHILSALYLLIFIFCLPFILLLMVIDYLDNKFDNE